MSGNITVAVRVRPLNARELAQNDHTVVEISGEQIILQRSAPRQSDGKSLPKLEPRIFKFDHAYDSIDHDSAHYTDQSQVFTDLGVSLLDGAFEGYNCCIFAYGQTGSGKSYSMMGNRDDQGIIPQICGTLFARIADVQKCITGLTCSVAVSYLEIYSEKVHDLLSVTGQRNLKVREHPEKGPYVEDLCSPAVHDYAEIEMLMDRGNKRRTVASTNMNETSSRSHAVFIVVLKQQSITAGVHVEKVSKISLVDLAGSERAQSTGASGARLKEGAEINKSLSTLGRVISILAEQNSRRRSSLLAKVPYRDSTLTWLLKDSLGGNSLTAMLATISPAASNYEETLSTLRYADSAKKIKNHAIINEDQNMKLIRELKEELETLRARMADQSIIDLPLQETFEDQMISITTTDGAIIQISKAEIAHKMSQSSKLLQDINLSWQEQLQQVKQIQQDRERALEELGIDMGNGLLGLSSPRKIPHLVNMSEHPLSTELLVYNLKRGRTTLGNVKSNTVEVKLSSASINPLHCIFYNNGSIVTVKPHGDSTVLVNGCKINSETMLWTGCRLVIGTNEQHIFRYNNPEETRTGTFVDHQNTETDSTSSVSTCSRLELVPGLDRPETHGILEHQTLEFVSPVSSINTNQMNDSTNLYSMEDSEAVRRRKRASDTERLLQELNADSLLSATKEPLHKTSLIERLKAIQVDAQKEIQSTSVSEYKSSHAMQRSKTQECSLISRVVDKWYDLANIKMTRSVLEQAHMLKEAQILCLQLKQNLNLQFVMKTSDNTFISPLEEDDVFDLHNAHLAAPLRAGTSEIVARIMDLDRGIILFWSLETLQTRVSRIKKQLLKHKRHSTAKSLQFIERPLPVYSLVGLSSVPVTLVVEQTSGILDVDIYSPFTTTQIAVLSIKLKTTFMSGDSECKVELQIVAIKGLSGSDELTDIHVHAYFEANPDMRLTTHIVQNSEQGTTAFSSQFSCLLSIDHLPDILCFELYGCVQSGLLEKILSWDNLQESHRATPSEADGLIHAVHNLICEIQILELDITGSYTPCEVLSTEMDDPGICCLHQGLSRRLVFSLLCSKEDLVKVNCIRLSDIQSTADNPDTATPSEPVQLRILYISEEASESVVKLTAQWDSSMHDTKLLDKTTPHEHVISVQASIDLEFRNSGHRELITRIPLRIHGREEQPGLFSRLFSASRSLPCHITTFPIPFDTGEEPNTIKLSKLSTAHRYQSGQELLQGWQPRGISLIQNHEIMHRTRTAAMALLKTKMTYTEDQLSVGAPKKIPSRDYIRDIIHYWQTRTRRNRIDDLETRVLASYPKSATSRIQSIDFSLTVKSGHLFLHDPSTRTNRKLFFALRVPYLLQYTSSTLSKLESVIDLSLAVVEDTSTTTFTVKSVGMEVSYIAPSESVQREWIALISRI